ncbi:BRI1 kinase inhibitor 1-like [Magnolia sinica]|uniref:BRI1 kinase inhibitor 1-like n=1 Tax=Magnolia sinica TaxID=86752 RepID=UPI00265A82CA|nr:BRI1 kinase inhibitor 1-like [Magnolia sinica]
MDFPLLSQTNNTIHTKQAQEEEQNQGPPPSVHQNPTSNSSLPPSSSSSPSHEFSFTISLHPTSQTTPPTPSSQTKSNDKAHPPSIAIDLSPADDIFFHGHLLPLHLLAHPSISPRNSTSLENLNLPIRDLIDDIHKRPTSTNGHNSTASAHESGRDNHNANAANPRSKNTKSFSLFSLAKWRKASEISDRSDEKKKARFDMGRALRRYVRAMRPMLYFRGGEKEKQEMRRQPYSFSGNLNSRWKEWGGRRGGEFSAPASMRTSPTNSGLLLATAAIASSNDSTMEELQSAIQAAIAHCKNSIAVKEEKCKC